jgi:DNA-binding response OmpR family regulator
MQGDRLVNRTSRIVVVEDEPAIRRGIVDTLQLHGFQVIEIADGLRAQSEAIRPDVDLLLLDLMLPRLDGLEVLRHVRQVRPHLPVIILTARGSEEDRVRGLTMGADDYVVKPFSARELLARIEAVLRRTQQSQHERIRRARLGTATIDLERREIDWGEGRRADLSETEAGILGMLIVYRDRAVSREEILTQLWGFSSTGVETRTIDMHIARLRTKLRDPSGNSSPEAILTVRNHGYMAGADLVPLETT